MPSRTTKDDSPAITLAGRTALRSILVREGGECEMVMSLKWSVHDLSTRDQRRMVSLLSLLFGSGAVKIATKGAPGTKTALTLQTDGTIST